MISIYEVYTELDSRIKRGDIDYCQDLIFTQPIDTRGCQEYFGTRGPNGVHVTGRNTAHLDRRDPRVDALGHILEDVLPPIAVATTVFVVGVGILTAIFGSSSN